MRELEKIIMEEISSLEDMRLIDVIGFIRYMKAEKPIPQKWVSGWFESALQSIHDDEEKLLKEVEALRKRKQGDSPNG